MAGKMQTHALKLLEESISKNLEKTVPLFLFSIDVKSETSRFLHGL